MCGGGGGIGFSPLQNRVFRLAGCGGMVIFALRKTNPNSVMKKICIFVLASCLVLLTSCDTYTGSGAYVGGSLGSILGSAIGGITGGPRGSDVGTVVGMAGGAAVGAVIGSAADQKAQAKREAELEQYRRDKAARAAARAERQRNVKDDVYYGETTTPPVVNESNTGDDIIDF